MMNISISHIEQNSKVNGPGIRAVVWVQGCSIGRTIPCPGCFNPKLWKVIPKTHDTTEIANLLNSIENISGVTFSGGEPLDQVDAVIDIISKLDIKRLTVMLFTGFTMEEITADSRKHKILQMVDLLKTGRYDEHRPTLSNWRSSLNQELHYLTNIISDSEEISPKIELNVKKDGSISMTGFPSKSFIKKIQRMGT